MQSERTYRFRMTKVTTNDYGDGPAGGQRTIATLARLSDGSLWDDFPQVIQIGVPLGTRPGATFTLTLCEDAPNAD